MKEKGKTSGLGKPVGFSCELKKLRRQQQVDSWFGSFMGHRSEKVMNLGNCSWAFFLSFNSWHIHRIYIFLIPPQQSKTVFLRMKPNKNLKRAPVKTESCGLCRLSFAAAISETTLRCFAHRVLSKACVSLPVTAAVSTVPLACDVCCPCSACERPCTAPMQPVTWN